MNEIITKYVFNKMRTDVLHVIESSSFRFI